MFRVVLPPIIRSAYTCIYSIWYLSHCYCYLPLSWKSWNWFECAVGGIRHPQHTETSKWQTALTVWKIPDAADTVVCAPDDGWKYHPKHVQQFPDINKLCDVASCWIYEYIGILLGTRPVLHISRIKVNINRRDEWYEYKSYKSHKIIQYRIIYSLKFQKFGADLYCNTEDVSNMSSPGWHRTATCHAQLNAVTVDHYRYKNKL
jgi:hypothetical protein